ncbi:hypothetical protein HPB50_012888 [Hyalomma asiaticum]|uniref:Uncharacterized protein n=1 Tax=Hyalomma asiaticum TaxID=266040 RepID=A0ACB7SSF0_HYAAI|nr:hypothetical protein HPB50_012888 [Hyalomma asiaticum]
MLSAGGAGVLALPADDDARVAFAGGEREPASADLSRRRAASHPWRRRAARGSRGGDLRTDLCGRRYTEWRGRPPLSGLAAMPVTTCGGSSTERPCCRLLRQQRRRGEAAQGPVRRP